MAKQTYTAGQVLTASQMSALQANDYNQTVSTKTTSYTLVAGDVGTRIVMNSATDTTITVNTSLFSAGDTLDIQNIGTGRCTVTAGTCTVTTSGSLSLNQWSSGKLYFTSASASVFIAGSVVGEWTSYTPVLTASTTNPTLGTGSTVIGSYVQIKNVVIYRFYIGFGTSGVNAGSGFYYVSLPVTASQFGNFFSASSGQTAFYDSSANSIYFANAWMDTSARISIIYQQTFNGPMLNVTNSVPVTAAANDVISGYMIYQAA